MASVKTMLSSMFDWLIHPAAHTGVSEADIGRVERAANKLSRESSNLSRAAKKHFGTKSDPFSATIKAIATPPQRKKPRRKCSNP